MKPTARCGTTSGERKHRRENTSVCADCRNARNADERRRRAASYAPHLTYTGGWFRDGLILRPLEPRRPE